MGWVKNMMKIVVFAFIVHIIGAAIMIIISCKNGTMEYASKHENEDRWANPSDIIFYYSIMWEFLLLLQIVDEIGSKINTFFKKYFKI